MDKIIKYIHKDKIRMTWDDRLRITLKMLSIINHS